MLGVLKNVIIVIMTLSLILGLFNYTFGDNGEVGFVPKYFTLSNLKNSIEDVQQINPFESFEELRKLIDKFDRDSSNIKNVSDFFKVLGSVFEIFFVGIWSILYAVFGTFVQGWVFLTHFLA